MVRPASRGGNAPPPPEYMAGMIQQLEMNRQFMETVMAQFPHPNMGQQQGVVTLNDFARLNPSVYRSSTQPLMLMTGSVTLLLNWSLLELPLPTMSPLRHTI